MPPFLTEQPVGDLVVVGAGKAAGAMAAVLERQWHRISRGLVVVPHGYDAACRQIEVVEAAHPVPDAAGARIAARMLDLVSNLSEHDHVVALISGGGSSLLCLPAPGITLADKQRVNAQLLRSGASVSEINCVRKHLSAIKGGRLAQACWPASVQTFAISDVAGDIASAISSGPTVADPTSSADAIAILRYYDLAVSDAILSWLQDPRSETLKPGTPALARTSMTIVANAQGALDAAAAAVRAAGLTPLVLGELEGESREVAKVHAGIVRQIRRHGQPLPAPCVLLSGGETTVTVRGGGRGGRNTEFLLSLLNELRGEPGVWALAADTDGIDGMESNAGAVMTPNSFARARAAQLDCASALADNDGAGFFEALDALITTGPTNTNVNDFRAILIA